MNILSETRTIVEDPKQTVARLRRMFKKLSAKPQPRRKSSVDSTGGKS